VNTSVPEGQAVPTRLDLTCCYQTLDLTFFYIDDILSCMNSILLTMLIKSILFNPKYRVPQEYMDFMLCPTLQIDSDNQLRTTLYSNRDDFIFPTVNSLFKCSNIPVTHAYGVYISQLIVNIKDCKLNLFLRGFLSFEYYFLQLRRLHN